MHPLKKFVVAISSLFFAFAPANLPAVLPPSVYESMQKDAPESLEIEVLRIQRTPSSEEGKEDITLTAAVVKVLRSASGLTPGDSIQIRYRHILPAAMMPGAPQIPVPDDGAKTIAFLKKKDASPFYEPAAEAMSFNKF